SGRTPARSTRAHATTSTACVDRPSGTRRSVVSSSSPDRPDPKPTEEQETNEWEEMLRKIGLGVGLHEPRRTRGIDAAVANLAEVLAEHDRQVAEQARDGAREAFGEEEESLDRDDLVSNVRLANPHRAREAG